MLALSVVVTDEMYTTQRTTINCGVVLVITKLFPIHHNNADYSKFSKKLKLLT